jgi:hypothetical protein
MRWIVQPRDRAVESASPAKATVFIFLKLGQQPVAGCRRVAVSAKHEARRGRMTFDPGIGLGPLLERHHSSLRRVVPQQGSTSEAAAVDEVDRLPALAGIDAHGLRHRGRGRHGSGREGIEHGGHSMGSGSLQWARPGSVRRALIPAGGPSKQGAESATPIASAPAFCTEWATGREMRTTPFKTGRGADRIQMKGAQLGWCGRVWTAKTIGLQHPFHFKRAAACTPQQSTHHPRFAGASRSNGRQAPRLSARG